MNDWKKLHTQALCDPRGPEVPIVGLLDSWIEYARVHRDRYSSLIGDDEVLGPQWYEIGKALVRLLDGETGRLDCASLWEDIDRTMKEHGWPLGLDH